MQLLKKRQVAEIHRYKRKQFDLVEWAGGALVLYSLVLSQYDLDGIIDWTVM